MPLWLEFLFLLFFGGPPVNCRPDADGGWTCQVGQAISQTTTQARPPRARGR